MLRLTLLSGRWRSGWPFLLGALFALSCTQNRPDAPAVPVGPDLVELDSAYAYKTSVEGTGHGHVFVRFDWGDGDTFSWCGPGETVECSHRWRDGGVYAVRAQALDDRPRLSEWSAPCSVTAVVPEYPFRLIDSVFISDEDLLIEVQVLPGGEFVYVTSEWDASLWVVRTSDLRLVAEVPFYAGWWGGEGGGRMVCSPDGEYVYATYYRGDYLAAVSTAAQLVVDSLLLGGEEMTSIAISPDGGCLFVAVSYDSGYVLEIRLPDFVIADTLFMPGMDVYISSMTLSPDGTRLYAANLGEYCILSVRLSDHAIEWRAPSDLDDEPDALVLHPTGRPLYVLNEERISIHEPGTGSLIDSIAFTPFWGADIDADGSSVYITCGGYDSNGGVGVVRTSDNKVARVIDMHDEVYDVAVSPDGQRAYVASGNGKLYVLSR
jgi:DNA-binding beta-propeller fold protein YncE